LNQEMPIRRPSRQELLLLAYEHHFTLTDQELEAILTIIDESLNSYDIIDQWKEPKLPVNYPRDPGYMPSIEENTLGGWAWCCSIKGAEKGRLSGKRIAVKDNIAVAGIPLLNGSAVMKGFIADVDATIITRILDAGGEIAGKAMCGNMCFDGLSHASYPRPVMNPFNPAYMTSGSSSGSAALVGSGAVDIALGCDQGGSIRGPASWCGVIGLKPTYGLVPYTGILSLEPTLDHVGPITTTVKDMALILEVIAGRDQYDPRTNIAPKEVPLYSSTLVPNVRGKRIALIKEGFEWPASEPEVEESVRMALEKYVKLGAHVKEVSLPWHKDASHVFGAVVNEGSWGNMVHGEGVGNGFLGYYDTHVAEFFALARRLRGDDFPINIKLVTLLASYMANRYHRRYYNKAQNLRYTLRAAYDSLLREYDFLAMPTTPQRARIYEPDLIEPTADNIRASMNMIGNLCPFNLTHHPALSIPCGISNGRPVGLQLIAKHWEESDLLCVAYAFEQQTS
jgi:amidase